jgi:hypothetical protein
MNAVRRASRGEKMDEAVADENLRKFKQAICQAVAEAAAA